MNSEGSSSSDISQTTEFLGFDSFEIQESRERAQNMDALINTDNVSIGTPDTVILVTDSEEGPTPNDTLNNSDNTSVGMGNGEMMQMLHTMMTNITNAIKQQRIDITNEIKQTNEKINAQTDTIKQTKDEIKQTNERINEQTETITQLRIDLTDTLTKKVAEVDLSWNGRPKTNVAITVSENETSENGTPTLTQTTTTRNTELNTGLEPPYSTTTVVNTKPEVETIKLAVVPQPILTSNKEPREKTLKQVNTKFHYTKRIGPLKTLTHRKIAKKRKSLRTIKSRVKEKHTNKGKTRTQKRSKPITRKHKGIRPIPKTPLGLWLTLKHKKHKTLSSRNHLRYGMKGKVLKKRSFFNRRGGQRPRKPLTAKGAKRDKYGPTGVMRRKYPGTYDSTGRVQPHDKMFGTAECNRRDKVRPICNNNKIIIAAA